MDKAPKKNISDKNIHRSFQLGALLLIIYVGYSLYFEAGNTNGIIDPQDTRYMSDEELNARIKASLEKVASEPEYKKIKEFVDYIEVNVNPTESRILDTKAGILIFVPADKIKNDNSFEVKNETLNMTINSKKLSEVDTKPIDNDKNSGVETGK